MKNILSDQYTVSHTTATILIVATALLWSLGGLLIKMVDCHPLAIAGLRSAIASVFLLILMRRPRFTWSFPQVAGAVSFSATVITFVLATKLTTAANAIVLQYSAPIYVSLLGIWILKERVWLRDIVAMVVVLGGTVLFFLDSLSANGLYGDIFGVVAGISFACFFVFTRMQKEGSPIETILLGNILTALVGVPFTFVQFPDISGWLVLLLLGIVQLGVPYVLYSIAIKRVTALEAVLTCTLEPILNPLWVFLVIGEMPGKWAWIGGLIVIAAVTVRGILSAVAANAAAKYEYQATKR
jgi:drug/metabolite transporter (DMT)-like permease